MTDPTDPSSAPVPADASPGPIQPAATPMERARVEAPEKRASALPLLYLLGFIVLVGAVGYLYVHPPGADLVAAESETGAQLDALSTRLEQLEQRPAPNLTPLEARLAGVEARLGALEARAVPPPVDLGPLTAKLDAGTAALAGRLDGLDRRVTEAEQMAKSGADTATQIGIQVDAKIDAKLGAAAGSLDAKLGQANAQIAAQVDAKLGQSAAQLTSQVEAKLGQSSAQVASQVDAKLGTLTDTARRLAALQTAGAALESGQKLGAIPGAPPALARFADQAPPTPFALRQSFGPAAEAALQVSQPVVAGDKPFLDRLWTRAQASVSVREGDRVLVGDPVAGVIGRARAAVEGGDFAAALAALQDLSGPPKAAMADWAGQAQALLDARAALAQLAAHG